MDSFQFLTVTNETLTNNKKNHVCMYLLLYTDMKSGTETHSGILYLDIKSG